jgi:hypothetical protein
MAKATLELVIVDSGPPPVGGPAPQGSAPSFTQAPDTGAPQERSAPTVVVPPVSAPMASDAFTNRGGGRIGLPAPPSSIPIEGGNELIMSPITAPPPAPPIVPPAAGAGLASAALAAAAAVAAFASAATAASLVMDRVSDHLHGEAEKAAQFSPIVANATAQSEIRDMLNEMRRAQRIGPELAQAENARSRFNSAMSEFETETLGLLAKAWSRLEPTAEKVVNLLTFLVEAAGKAIDGVQEVIRQMPAQTEEQKKLMEKWFKEHQPGLHPEWDQFMDPFAKDLADQARPPMHRDKRGHMVPLGI